MNAYVFLYGSLRGACNGTRSQWLTAFSENMGQAYCQGALYDLGDYCGLHIHADGQRIEGEIVALSDPQKQLPLLDKYEGLQEAYAQYHRKEMDFQREDGSVIKAWVYLLQNRLSSSYPVIPESSYLQFLEKNQRHQDFVYQ